MQVYLAQHGDEGDGGVHCKEPAGAELAGVLTRGPRRRIGGACEGADGQQLHRQRLGTQNPDGLEACDRCTRRHNGCRALEVSPSTHGQHAAQPLGKAAAAEAATARPAAAEAGAVAEPAASELPAAAAAVGTRAADSVAAARPLVGLLLLVAAPLSPLLRPARLALRPPVAEAGLQDAM